MSDIMEEAHTNKVKRNVDKGLTKITESYRVHMINYIGYNIINPDFIKEEADVYKKQLDKLYNKFVLPEENSQTKKAVLQLFYRQIRENTKWLYSKDKSPELTDLLNTFMIRPQLDMINMYKEEAQGNLPVSTASDLPVGEAQYETPIVQPTIIEGASGGGGGPNFYDEGGTSVAFRPTAPPPSFRSPRVYAMATASPVIQFDNTNEIPIVFDNPEI